MVQCKSTTLSTCVFRLDTCIRVNCSDNDGRYIRNADFLMRETLLMCWLPWLYDHKWSRPLNYHLCRRFWMRSQGTGSKYLRTCNSSWRRVRIKIQVYNFCSRFRTSVNPGFKFWWGTITCFSARMWITEYTECQHTQDVTLKGTRILVQLVVWPSDQVLWLITNYIYPIFDPSCLLLEEEMQQQTWALFALFFTACLSICEN